MKTAMLRFKMQENVVLSVTQLKKYKQTLFVRFVVCP